MLKKVSLIFLNISIKRKYAQNKKDLVINMPQFM
jgi:hypothetical protein